MDAHIDDAALQVEVQVFLPWLGVPWNREVAPGAAVALAGLIR